LDKPFVRKLAHRLTEKGIICWIDEAELNIGDSLIEKISEGIEKMRFVAAIISNNSVKSNWVQKELSLAMSKEIKGRKVVVLPLLLNDCQLPSFLKDKMFADFRIESNFEKEFAKVMQAIGISSEKPDAAQAFARINDLLVTQPSHIRIVGINKNKTHIPDPRYSLYDVYFELSEAPSSTWSTIFEEERKYPRHSMWRHAWVEGKYIIVNCALEEIEKYHLRDIKEDIETVNGKYSAHINTIKAQKEAERKKREDEESKKNSFLDSLEI